MHQLSCHITIIEMFLGAFNYTDNHTCAILVAQHLYALKLAPQLRNIRQSLFQGYQEP